jgi:DNA gyrase inhibitor GyrI
MQNHSNHELESRLAESIRRESEALGFAASERDVACPEMRISRHGSGNPRIDATVMRRGIAPSGSLIRPDYKPADNDMAPSVVDELKIVEMQDMDVASVRFIGPYKGIGKAVGLLCRWADKCGLLGSDATVFGALHDSPVTTLEEDLRSDACIVAPPGIATKAPVYFQRINCKGSYVCNYFEFMNPREFPRRWSESTRRIQGRGLQIDDRPMLEIYHGNMLKWDGTFRVDICIPVRPL